EIAPLADRAESFVEEDQRRLAAVGITDPFIGDRAARRSRKRHAANVARDNRRLHAFHYLAGAHRHAAALVGQLDRGARGARRDLAGTRHHRAAGGGARDPAALRLARAARETAAAWASRLAGARRARPRRRRAASRAAMPRAALHH